MQTKRRDEISAESGSEMDEDLEEDMEEDMEDDLEEYDEQADDSEAAGDEDEEEKDENTKYLAQGPDLDLPDEEVDDSSDDDSDGKLDAYYKELGVERDNGKKQKGDGTKKEIKPSAKQELIRKLISNAKSDPSPGNLAMAMRLVKQVFNSAEKEEEEEEKKVKGKKKRPQPKKKTLPLDALNTSDYRDLFIFFLQDLPGIFVNSYKIKVKGGKPDYSKCNQR